MSESFCTPSHKHPGKVQVYIAHSRGISSPTIKCELRRRNAIFAAAGHNLRLLVAWLTALWHALITALLSTAQRTRALA